MTIELRAAGARAVFAPEFGGRLHQLFIDIDGIEQPLLLTPDSPAAYSEDPLFGGCYPMAPWPNRISEGRFAWRGATVQIDNGREHALHGLVVDRPWGIAARVGRVLEMRCDVGPGWPWEGSCWQRFELGPGYLAMKMEVRSAREPFPAGCGWHPWFHRRFAGAGEVALEVPAGRRYEMESKLPTGRPVAPKGEKLLDGSPLGSRAFDDCYAGLQPPTATIRWPSLELAASIACPEPHLQVFATDEALCLEPQTCAPDAFNLAARGVTGTGQEVAAPGRPVSLACRWTWRVM